MPRTKAMSTVARELAKSFSPEQLRALSEHVLQEAEKPRVDRRVLGRLQRTVKAAYVKQYRAEEELTTFLSEAGKTNDEINEEMQSLRRDAEREAVSGTPAKATRRGRPRKNPEA